MKIIINNSSMVPIYEQIMEQIKAQIISGELKENDILPSVRTMAKELKISALTVKKAYDNLEAEGMTVTVHWKRNLCCSFEYTADGRRAQAKKLRRIWKRRFRREDAAE